MATVNIFNMADTWNNVATTYTAIKMNVTDTASASGSLLLDLQVGGASRFRIRKDGSLFLNSTTGRLYQYGGAARWVFTDQGSNANCIWIQTTDAPFALGLASTVNLTWTSSTDVAASPTLFLRRRADANLQLGAADAASPVAQTLGVQSVVAGTTNTAGADFTIAGSQGTGTGAGGSIIFKVAPAGSSGTAQNALATALTINSAGRAQMLTGSTTGVYVNDGGAGLIGFYHSGTRRSFIFGQSNGGLEISCSNNQPLSLTGTVDGGIRLSTNGLTSLFTDAADILALRNGTNAQTFNVYKAYTSGTDYSRVALFATGGGNFALLSQVGTGGSSVGGNFYIGTTTAHAVNFSTNNTDRWSISGSGGHFLAVADNTYDIGASGATRPRNLFVGGGMTTGAPTGGTSGTWKLGVAATVSPTSPNRTIEVDIGGTIYYIHAKTTND